jgi:hypothetical protein
MSAFELGAGVVARSISGSPQASDLAAGPPLLGVALALGRLLVVEPGEFAFALRPLLGLSREAVALLGRLRLLLGEFALTPGLVIVDLGDAAFAFRPLLSLSSAAFALLGRLSVLVRRGRNFRRALALTPGLVVLLRRRGGVGLSFLAVSGGVAAKPLALTTSVLGRSLGRAHRQHSYEQERDQDGNHGNR